MASPQAIAELRQKFGPRESVIQSIASKQAQLDALTADLVRDYADRDLLEAVKSLVFGDHGRWKEHADVLEKQFKGVSTDTAVLAIVRRVNALQTRLSKELTIAETVPFLAGLLQWSRASCPHFALAPDFFHALTVTDFADKSDETPLQLPFHAFTMAFPKSPLLGNATRLFVYRLPRVVSTEATELTWPLWRATLYPEGLEGGGIFSQWDSGITRGDFAGGDPNLDRLPERGLARKLDEEEATYMRPARILIANVLAYIEAKGPLPAKRPERHAAPAPLERVRDDRSTFDVGRTVKLDGGIRRAMLASAGTGSGARWTLSQRYIVRGHWRNQVHGEGRLLRRRQWIEPFWKGPADIEAAIARTYEVGTSKEEEP